jgi:hypothetical protein
VLAFLVCICRGEDTRSVTTQARTKARAGRLRRALEQNGRARTAAAVVRQQLERETLRGNVERRRRRGGGRRRVLIAIDGRGRGGRVFAADGDLENRRHKLVGGGAVVLCRPRPEGQKGNERSKVRKVASVGAPCETGENWHRTERVCVLNFTDKLGDGNIYISVHTRLRYLVELTDRFAHVWVRCERAEAPQRVCLQCVVWVRQDVNQKTKQGVEQNI